MRLKQWVTYSQAGEHRVPTSLGHISDTGIHLAHRHPRSHSNYTRTKAVAAFTVASSSNLPKSSLRSLTSSWAVHYDTRLVKPTMSAKRMLQDRGVQAALLHGRTGSTTQTDAYPYTSP